MVRIVTSANADADVERIASWWREHREKAPFLFEEEFGDAMALLAATPYAGIVYAPKGRPAVRRLLLRSTKQHVYYEVDGDMVRILSVRGAVKRHGPRLKGPRK